MTLSAPMGFFDDYPLVAAWFGAGVLYILNLLNSRQPFSVLDALERATRRDPSHRTYWEVITDLFASSGIGSLLVMLIVAPKGGTDAAIAGLGLTGILSAFGKDV